MDFGSYIKGLRLAKGLKQKEVVDYVHINKSYLSNLESGKDEPPSEDVLIKMSEVLGEDKYEFIVKAGRVPTDFKNIIINDKATFNYLKKKTRSLNVKEGE